MLGVDGLLGGGDTEVVLRLSDPESEGVGRGALALPSEGSHADPLLGRQSLRLGGEEGRGESGVGLLPTEGNGGARCVRGGHPESSPCGRGGGQRIGGLFTRSNSSAVGRGGGLGVGGVRQRRGPMGLRPLLRRRPLGLRPLPRGGLRRPPL